MSCHPYCNWDNLFAQLKPGWAGGGLSIPHTSEVTCTECGKVYYFSDKANIEQLVDLVCAAAQKIFDLETQLIENFGPAEIARLQVFLSMPWVQEAIDESLAATVKLAKAQNTIQHPNRQAPWKVTK